MYYYYGTTYDTECDIETELSSYVNTGVIQDYSLLFHEADLELGKKAHYHIMASSPYKQDHYYNGRNLFLWRCRNKDSIDLIKSLGGFEKC